MNQFARGMAQMAKVGATAVIVIAGVVILGHAMKHLISITLGLGPAGMSALTAVALIGIVLPLIGETQTRMRWAIPAAISIAIERAGLGSFLVNGMDTLSPFVTHSIFGLTNGISGKTSIAAACCVVLLGVAQIGRMKRRYKASDWLSAAALLILGMALMGYAYGAQGLYEVVGFNLIALHTAAALFTLALATICSQGSHGWAATVSSSRPGGVATRRQLAFTLLPPLAGWYLLHVTLVMHIGPGMALASLVVVTVAPLIASALLCCSTTPNSSSSRTSTIRPAPVTGA